LTLTGVRERIATKSDDRRLHSVFRSRLGKCAAEGLPLGDLAALPRMAARSSRATCDAPGFIA
jgi:hypothetical protein